MKNKTPSKLTSHTRIAICVLAISVLLLVGCIVCWLFIKKYTVKPGAMTFDKEQPHIITSNPRAITPCENDTYCEAGECSVHDTTMLIHFGNVKFTRFNPANLNHSEIVKPIER